MTETVYFQVLTPLGFTIRTTKNYWHRITTIKHPSIKRFEKDIIQALRNPDQVRKSKQDQKVHLYYKNIGKLFVCVVADHDVKVKEGYIITAYLTNRIKEGEEICQKLNSIMMKRGKP